MGIVHIPRTAAAIIRGMAKRRLSPLTKQEKSLVGLGANPPHIYSSRAGLFDVDLMMHMNNASYLTHAELARWEWTAFSGLLPASLKTKSYFIVTASILRFRREIAPLKKFEIETRGGKIDDRNLWVYQTFHSPNSNGERSKVLCQVFTQGVMTNKGKVINPREWLADNLPSAKDALDGLTEAPLFDEKATQFTKLEDTLRRSAALHDDKVTK